MQQSPWEPDARPADQFFAVHEAIRFNIRASWNREINHESITRKNQQKPKVKNNLNYKL